MKKVIVTGGAGFVGRELVYQLSSVCDEIIVIDNLVNGKADNVSNIKNVKLFTGDIKDTQGIRHLFKDVDVVFHLACLGVRHSIHSPHENYNVNSTLTLNLLSLSKEMEVKKFVYISSSEVYGKCVYTPIDENHPTFPTTVYGASKLSAESHVRAFYSTYGYSTVIIRPFNIYGPYCHHEKDSGEVIPKFLIRVLNGSPITIFGDGNNSRDFTYVSDTVNGIILAASSPKCIGETINIGTGKEISLNDLAKQINDMTGQKSEIIHDQSRPGDTVRLWADISKAKKLLGFEPKIKLDVGLQKLKEWYLSSNNSLEKLLKEDIVHNWKS